MEDLAGLKRRTAYLSIISNTTLMLLKLAVGVYVGAVSLISEAMHSGVDLIAAFVAFWAVRRSLVPPDSTHDYGHGKYESVAAAVESVLIIGAAMAIIGESLDKLREPTLPENLELGLIIMALSVAVNYFVARRLLAVAKKTNSQALRADGEHLRADIWTSLGVLAGLAGMNFFDWPWLDPVIAIFVAGIIFRVGWHMIRESLGELTDISLPPEEEARIVHLIERRSDVYGCHCLRTRKSGSYRLLDVHVLFDGDMPLKDVHKICDELENAIRRHLGAFDVLIHAEPHKNHTRETKVSVYRSSSMTENNN